MGDGRLSSVDDHACYTTFKKKKIKKLMCGEITMSLPNWKADACRPIRQNRCSCLKMVFIFIFFK